VAKQAKVSVTVSLGAEEKKIRVPNLVGMPEADGTISAIENGLTIGSVTEVFSSDYGEGLICAQSLAVGSYVAADSTVDISVSKGSGIVTYKYNASITAPTPEEAPHYVSGTEVSVKLVTSDGTVLLDTKVSSFPQSANYYGLKSPGGTITMTYTYTKEGTSTVVTAEDGTQTTVTTPGETVTETFTRDVTFIQE
jgi:serine/threonine-protein kinase